MEDFILGIKNYYSYTKIDIDPDYNIILTGNNYQLLVPLADIKPYYDGYLKSAVPQKVMIARAAGFLVNLAKEYEKKH